MENAVPRHTLNTIRLDIGYCTNHAVAELPNSRLSVPPSRSSTATHRYATTVLGRIHDSSTNPSVTRRSHFRASRSVHARVNPRRFWPITADPSTNSSVSHSELPNSGSVSAPVRFAVPTSDGFTDAGPVSV